MKVTKMGVRHANFDPVYYRAVVAAEVASSAVIVMSYAPRPKEMLVD